MCTATAKDSPGWRTVRDQKRTSKHWKIERLRYNETPFIWPEHWERMQDVLTAREWKRRGLAEDVGPERQTYHTWDRDQNLRPRPDIGAVDVTADVLKRGQNYVLLGGHDPGSLFDVSLLLKAYRLPKSRRHSWWVVDEITTEQTTSEQHAKAVMDRLRNKWHCYEVDRHGVTRPDCHRSFFRGDPYGDSDSKPDVEVYKRMKRAGIEIAPAAYRKGKNSHLPGRIAKEARIEVVCSLLCNSRGERHLFVDCDDRRTPAAPLLVKALETEERDLYGKAETARKDRTDTSHWAAALGYALHPYEKERLQNTAYRKAH